MKAKDHAKLPRNIDTVRARAVEDMSEAAPSVPAPADPVKGGVRLSLADISAPMPDDARRRCPQAKA